jgi:acetyltransferase-like isoleucine patch superfamily enzyme
MKKVSFYKWCKKRLKRHYRALKQEYLFEMQHPTVTLEPDVRIKHPERLSLGKDVYICTGTLLECGGEEWCNYGGGITIGDAAYIDPYAVLLGAGGIELGKRCSIGHAVLITSYAPDVAAMEKDHTLRDNPIMPHEFGSVKIEDNVMIGPHCIILRGVTIGKNAKITGGSIIRHDVPPDSFIFPNTKFHNRTYRIKK